MKTVGKHEFIPISRIELDTGNPRIAKFLEMYSGKPTAEQIFIALGAGGDEKESELFMRQSGLSPASCWRYRKRGWLKTIVIAGRHYITREAIADFNRRAAEGEFAGVVSNPSRRRAGNGYCATRDSGHGRAPTPNRLAQPITRRSSAEI